MTEVTKEKQIFFLCAVFRQGVDLTNKPKTMTNTDKETIAIFRPVPIEVEGLTEQREFGELSFSVPYATEIKPGDILQRNGKRYEVREAMADHCKGFLVVWAYSLD